jgi:hypothetical protein
MYDIGVFFPFWKFLGVLKRTKVYRFLHSKSNRMLHLKNNTIPHLKKQQTTAQSKSIIIFDQWN